MQLQRHRSSSRLQFKEICLDSAQSLGGLPDRIQVKPGAVAVGNADAEPMLRISKADAEKLRFVKKSLMQQQQKQQQQQRQQQSEWDEIETATVASATSTRSWWGRTLGRGARASAARDYDDTKSVTSVMSRFSLFGGGRRKAKKKSKAQLTQERILSEFFDVQSVANDGRLHDRLNQERVVAKFFDVQSVQTETPGSRKRFSFFRRKQREDVEAKSVASLGSIGIIFFHPNEVSRGPVPDDETITLASGLFSSANSVIIEESESSSGDDMIDFPVPGDHHLQSSSSSIGTSSSGKKSRTPSTSTFIQEVAAAQKLMSQQDAFGPRSPVKLPNPARPSLADFDRWSSQASVNSSSSSQDPTVIGTAPKQPSRRRMSGQPSEESKARGSFPGDQSDEESVVSLLSGIVANYAAAKAEYERGRTTCRENISSSTPSRPSLKKPIIQSRPTYSVVFDSVIIREYARTVGDNPSCTCGPPVTLDWQVLSCEYVTVEDYEASKPVKRTKKQFYLPARTRATILTEDWDITEDELKRARREVTYIQYCRERSVAGCGGRSSQEGGGLSRRANNSARLAALQATLPSGSSMATPAEQGSPADQDLTGPSPLQQEPSAPPPKSTTRSVSPPRSSESLRSDGEDEKFEEPLSNDSGTCEDDEVISVSNPQDQQDVTTPPNLEMDTNPHRPLKSKLSRQNSLSSLGSLEPIRMTLEQCTRRRMEI